MNEDIFCIIQLTSNELEVNKSGRDMNYKFAAY
jgi:hypothetical protein